MKVWKILLCVGMMALCLLGCGSATSEPSETVAKMPLHFDLPEGYEIADATVDTCSILLEDTVVGGFVRTEMDVDTLDEVEDEVLYAYLDSLAPLPKMLEYIAMRAENFVGTTVKITDTEAGTVQNQTHYFFLKDGDCYDMWLDNDLLDRELNGLFLDAAGIR